MSTHVYIVETGEDHEGLSVRGVFNRVNPAYKALKEYIATHYSPDGWELVECNEVDCVFHYKRFIDNVRIKRYVVL